MPFYLKEKSIDKENGGLEKASTTKPWGILPWFLSPAHHALGGEQSSAHTAKIGNWGFLILARAVGTAGITLLVNKHFCLLTPMEYH